MLTKLTGTRSIGVTSNNSMGLPAPCQQHYPGCTLFRLSRNQQYWRALLLVSVVAASLPRQLLLRPLLSSSLLIWQLRSDGERLNTGALLIPIPILTLALMATDSKHLVGVVASEPVLAAVVKVIVSVPVLAEAQAQPVHTRLLFQTMAKRIMTTATTTARCG